MKAHAPRVTVIDTRLEGADGHLLRSPSGRLMYNRTWCRGGGRYVTRKYNGRVEFGPSLVPVVDDDILATALFGG